MKTEDVGREVVIIFSSEETVTGKIFEIVDEHQFRLKTNNGTEYLVNDNHVQGIKFKGGGQ